MCCVSVSEIPRRTGTDGIIYHRFVKYSGVLLTVERYTLVHHRPNRDIGEAQQFRKGARCCITLSDGITFVCCSLPHVGFANVFVAWHIGRTSVFGRRIFPALRSTCISRVTSYMGKSCVRCKQLG